MSRFARAATVGLAFGVLVYAIALLYADLSTTRAALRGFAFSAIAWALLASSLNYALRFCKWEFCLRWLKIRGSEPNAEFRARGDAHARVRLPLGRSLLIYLAGLSMSVTPGKLGEVMRSGLLHASDGVPVARTAPIVVADRATDLIALSVLSLIGVSRWPGLWPWVLATTALVSVGVLVLGTPALFGRLLHLLARTPGIGALFARAEGLVEASATLLRLDRLLWLSVISVVGWGLECWGYWQILSAFAGVSAPLRECAFAWAGTTLVGALSFMPGGLGATELSLAALVPQISVGAGPGVAVASTILIRACTLWYGVVLGSLCLLALLADKNSGARVRLSAALKDSKEA